MPYLHRSLRPQPHPVPGDARTIHSSGQSFEQLRQGCLQSGTLFEDADFPASNSSLFYSERPQVPFVWKRPGVSRGRGGDKRGDKDKGREGGRLKGMERSQSLVRSLSVLCGRLSGIVLAEDIFSCSPATTLGLQL